MQYRIVNKYAEYAGIRQKNMLTISKTNMINKKHDRI